MALRATPCDVNRLRRLYDQMSRKLIGGMVPRRRNSEDDLYGDDVPRDDDEELVPGPYFAKFQKKFAGELEKLCGKNGSQLVQLAKVISSIASESLVFLERGLVASSVTN